MNLKDRTAERQIKRSRHTFHKKKRYFFAIIKTQKIKRINQLDREGVTDSKEENRKEKDQIEQEIHNFESERMNC